MIDSTRRTYIKAIGSIPLVGAAAGCLGADATGTLATQVTDQPGDIADFESCVITVNGFWLGPDDADEGDEEADDEEEADGEETEQDAEETDQDAEETEQAEGTQDAEETEDEEAQTEADDEESSGREYHEFDEPQEADLVQLQDEQTELIDERDLEVGTYEFLQLDTDGVDATLVDGSSATVEVPGEAPLTFNKPFDIREDTQTTFTADFTPVLRGGTGEYLLQPVPDGITVEYDDGE